MKLEELLSKYNKTVDELDFETEGLSDEELEAKFVEAFNETHEEFEENPVNDNPTPSKFSKTFELSFNDIRQALYMLLQPYEEAANDWFWINEIYDTYFVYQGMNGNYWGQKYTKDGDNVAFDGERYELYSMFLTSSEKEQIESMRSNYSSIVEELNKYKVAEDIADKMSIFEDESYSDYLETDEFKELMSEDTLKKFSKEELQVKADAALGKIVKKNKVFSFSADNKEKKVNKIGINSGFEKDSDNSDPYGDYFKSLSTRY